MTKLTLFLMSICMAAVVEQCAGFNYYWPYPGSQDIVAIPQFAPIQGLWPPVENCDKKENVEEGSSESSSSESSSSESESSESESKESGESGEEKEEEGSKEESKSSSEEEEGSSSSEEGEKKEGSGEEEGKEEPKKKKKKESKESAPIFPTSYLFPPRQALFAPSSSYAVMPFRTSYVIQRPATTYPMKSSYQYVLPSSPAVLGGYSSPITYSRVISNPVAKFTYPAPAIGYPSVAKTYVAAPSASLYSVPAASYTYIKK